jgi:hypothetical protein
MTNTPTPGGCMRQLFDWFWDPPLFGDRRIQACCVVVFCVMIIVVVYLSPSGKADVDGRIIDWSFATLLGVVGIYHTACGIDELLGRPSNTTIRAQNGGGAEMSAWTETIQIPPLR